jgi:argininosuccinate lyase
VVAGFTHLQQAEPVLAAHWALSHVEPLRRDVRRLGQVKEASLAACPLGAAALSGTPVPVDRAALAQDLGFAAPAANSMDAVSDRDFALGFLHASALALVHASRLAEDLVLFTTREFGFARLPDAFTTGSSALPQKRNADACELARAKAARVLGRYTAFAATLRGLPTGYNKDLQEDKEALFGAVDSTRACLSMCALVVNNAQFRAERCRAEASRGYLDATDLADLLVKAGVPFRKAHERVGAAVRSAIELGVELAALPADVKSEHLPELTRVDLARELAVDTVLSRRNTIGGTAPSCVTSEIQSWKERLRTWNNRL